MLNLVVIRSADLEVAEKFYNHLGIFFEVHQHGKGPKHLAAEMYHTVFEIYPLKSTTNQSCGTRFGFSMDAIDPYLLKVENLGGRIVTRPYESEWGRRAVIEDPDGHKIELVGPSAEEDLGRELTLL